MHNNLSIDKFVVKGPKYSSVFYYISCCMSEETHPLSNTGIQHNTTTRLPLGGNDNRSRLQRSSHGVGEKQETQIHMTQAASHTHMHGSYVPVLHLEIYRE